MTSYERMVGELAGAAGAEIRIGSDRVCEMAIGEMIVLLKPTDANEEALTLFAVVSDGDTGGATLKKALQLNLFGSGTLGAHLGLFASALILSRDLPLAELTAGDFAERILAFAQQAEEIAQELSSVGEEAEDAAKPGESGIPAPFAPDFLMV